MSESCCVIFLHAGAGRRWRLTMVLHRRHWAPLQVTHVLWPFDYECGDVSWLDVGPGSNISDRSWMRPTGAPWAPTASSSGAGAGDVPSTRAPWATQPASSALRSVPAPPSSSAAAKGSASPQSCKSLAATPPCFPAPIDPSGWVFALPSKRITSASQLSACLDSASMRSFMGFLLALNRAALGRERAPSNPGSSVKSLLDLLQALSHLVDAVPPAPHALRYGNPAFRTWWARAASEAPALLAEFLPKSLAAAVPELTAYLVDSLGNATRIDYGTGHETTFAAFLYCLARLGVLREEDCEGVVLGVFERYLVLMRKVQTTYWLEPAGSHGVWGLDDYQFLPFLWGSSQLVDQETSIRPSAVHDDQAVREGACANLYLAAVQFVRRVKKGSLAVTSPLLTDISQVPSWSKVNRGLVKMYCDQVLGKVPVMQHYLFGSLLAFEQA